MSKAVSPQEQKLIVSEGMGRGLRYRYLTQNLTYT